MQEQTDIRVFIADDHETTIQKLSEIINAAPGMTVVGTAPTCKDLLSWFDSNTPGADVALVDIGMPDMDGFSAVRRIKAQHPKTVKVIIITGLTGRDYPAEAISSYADGFIAKNRHKDEIVEAITRVRRGEMVYLPNPEDPAQPVEPPKPLPVLSPSEKRVLCLMLKGMKGKEIGAELGYNLANTERIRRNMMFKLGVQNPTQLGAIAEKYGLCREPMP